MGIEVLGKEDAPEYRRHMLDESMYSFIQPVLKPIVLDTPNVTRDFAADRALQGNVSATPPEPEPEVPVSAEDFSASESFDGAREGWLFKSGPNGTGTTAMPRPADERGLAAGQKYVAVQS